MTVRRRAAPRYVLGLGAVVVALLPGAVAAATRGFDVSSTSAAAGDEITVEIHDRYIVPRTDLYMVLASGWDDTKPCGQVPGAIKVGVVVWTDLGQLVSVGVATFIVPAVSEGEYRLGEDVGLNEIPEPTRWEVEGARDRPPHEVRERFPTLTYGPVYRRRTHRCPTGNLIEASDK